MSCEGKYTGDITIAPDGKVLLAGAPFKVFMQPYEGKRCEITIKTIEKEAHN